MDAHDGIHSWEAVEWIFDSADQRLVSPPIALPAGQDPLTLSFWHRRRLGTVPQSDECDDAAILEITNNGGSTWNQLVAPELLTDPYDNMVADSPGPGGNPLAGRPAAWCGTKEWTRSRIDLGMFGGNTVQLRYRLGNHAGPVIADGWWYLDDIKVQSCPSGFGVSIDDGRAYAQYGKTLTYVVKLSNSAATPVSGISISNAFPPELDLLSAHWTCSGGAAATCTASSRTGCGAAAGCSANGRCERMLAQPASAAASMAATGRAAMTRLRRMDASTIARDCMFPHSMTHRAADAPAS